LKDVPRPFDYEALRTNTVLRAAATTPVYSYGGESGYIDVYDTNGLSIWHPNKRIQGKDYKQWKNKYPAMWKITKESFTKSFTTGYYTFVSKKGAKKRRKFMAAVHITNTPFVACASVYINDYFLPVQEIISKGEIDVCSNVFDEIYQAAEQNEERTRIIGGIVLVILSIAGVFAGLWFSGTISSPIRALSNAVQKIADGDFSAKVKEKGAPEIVQLAASFNSLGDKLVVYVDDLKKEVAVRETYQREIDIAREIQQSLLPRVFPAFPERNEFALYAGVMAVSRTLLRTVCSHEKDLAEAINYANNILCEDNDTCMFVTLFVANLNVKTGEIVYCNAGHHEACVLKENRKIDLFGVHGSPALGIVPDVQYKTGRYTLAAGDKIVLYTDGVTEAHSPAKELFGEERLFEILKRESNKSPEELYGKIIKELNGFQNGEIFDDITLLILERC